MKKIYGFAALCAALSLASCSNNDEPNAINTGTPGEKHIGYISINLKAADETRDPASGDYFVGTSAESKVTKGCVICFSGDDYVCAADFTPTFFTGTEGANNNIESVSKFNPIKVVEPDGSPIDKMITVLNLNVTDLSTLGLGITAVGSTTTEETESEEKQPVKTRDGETTTPAVITLSDVRTKLLDYIQNSDEDFVMSSAVTYNKATGSDGSHPSGGSMTYTTPVTAYRDPFDAVNKTVDVYVERLATRLDYKVKTSFTNSGADFSLDNGTSSNHDIVVTGISLGYVADKSYLVKELNHTTVEALTFADGFDWNALGDHRSHWAIVPALPAVADQGANQTWDNYLTNELGKLDPATSSTSNTSFEALKPWNGINTPNFDITAIGTEGLVTRYLHENTTARPTCLLITAYLKTEDGNADAQKDIFQAVANGKYYTEDNLKTLYADILSLEGYLKKKVNGTEVSYVSFTKDDIDLTNQKDAYSGWVQIKTDNLVKEGDKYYVYMDNNDVTAIPASKTEVASINSNLKTKKIADKNNSETLFKYRFYKWNKGKCYFFKSIEPPFVGRAGMVRNHYYDVDLQGVQGLGVPVFDPTQKIYPETPDPVDPNEPTDVYIRANINVLSWTYYTQGINFGED